MSRCDLLEGVQTPLKPARLALGEAFEPAHQGFDPPRQIIRDASSGQVHLGDAGCKLLGLRVDQFGTHRRQGVEAAGEPFDLAGERVHRRGISMAAMGAVLGAVGHDGVAHILDRQRQAAHFASVRLGVAQATSSDDSAAIWWETSSSR